MSQLFSKDFDQVFKHVKKNIMNDKSLSPEEMEEIDKHLNMVMRMKMLDILNEPKPSTESTVINMLLEQNNKLIKIIHELATTSRSQ